MKIEQMENHLILSEVNSFDLQETLECGQCFRFQRLDTLSYKIVAFGQELHIQQEGNTIVFQNTTREQFEHHWRHYFDLDRDYEVIKETLSQKDPLLKEAIAYSKGIRILNQEPWECLISFIISQNNHIPRIKQIIQNLASTYGKKINTAYSFPTPQQLKGVSEAEILLCRTGFRAKYIVDAVEKVADIPLEDTSHLSTEELRNLLMSIKGVGPKVSDCVLLFSHQRHEVFPTDVWVKRIMQYFYYDNKETDMKSIHQFAYERFGDLAGFAQQYLFHYARQQKIGA